ncbi:MAG: HAD hydrolase-like protein [Rhodobacteraceae bacterium]|nr:HAD hydrolase-like protein [Paracoccaceae bacterium]
MADAVAADADGIFDLYQSVLPRLPVPGRRGAAVPAANLGEIAQPFDLILLDAFGVLNIGEAAIAGAAERVAALRRAGKRVMVVTNAASYPKRHMMTRYRNLGFDFEAEDILSSRETLLAALADQPPTAWGVMADPRWGLEEFEHLDVSALANAPGGYDRAEGFILLGAGGWSETRHALLTRSLAARPRPVLVGNPDIVAPRDHGFTFEPGHFAHRLAGLAGVAPRFYGKPFAAVFDAALRRAPGISRDRVLMVGDTLHTDVLGGLAAGLRTALVTDTGSLHRNDVAGDIERSGIVPDYILPRI